MPEDKGLLIVYTGPGKGKTTCALGAGFRGEAHIGDLPLVTREGRRITMHAELSRVDPLTAARLDTSGTPTSHQASPGVQL